MFFPDFDSLDQGVPASKMMTSEERTAFFSAGADLISPLAQIIREYQAALSFWKKSKKKREERL